MNTEAIPPSNRHQRARVLVVDDEEDIRNLVAFNLRAAGMEVLVAESGPDAVQQTRTQLPDLVILDLMLPELDGISVCEMIRNLPDTADTPVIMLTAWATDRARLVGLKAGANEYLTKPFSPRELIRRAESLLARRAPNWVRNDLPRARLLTIDLENKRISADGRNIELDPEGFHTVARLFEALLERAARSNNQSPDS